MDLTTPVRELKGVGSVVESKLNHLGIFNLRDLLFYVPFRYINTADLTTIKQLSNQEDGAVCATILDVIVYSTARQKIPIIEAKLEDHSGTIRAIWFNQIFLKNRLVKNSQKIFYGKTSYDWNKKQVVFQSPKIFDSPKIFPVYHETAGLSSLVIYRLISQVCASLNSISDPLPTDIIDQFKLISRSQALNLVHSPQKMSDVFIARHRLGFEELLFFSLQIKQNQSHLQEKALPIATPINLIKKFIKSLPFNLTNGQRQVAWQILTDLTKKIPMQRLLMGEVGSGKTVIGAICALATSHVKLQTIWLAPTEVLAVQHYNSLSKMFSQLEIKIGLWTGSNKKADLAIDDIIIGTHALIQPKIIFNKIGLIIIDEQHRFGVSQRAFLKELTQSSAHFLSMTATPIPRTLAHTLYGNLNLSILDELPAQRKPITTKIITPKDKNQAYQFIRHQIRDGRQVFVITPLIEETISQSQLFDLDRANALAEYKKLSEIIFPEFKIGLMHGKLSAKEKNYVMSEFNLGRFDILVSTAVVEVGVDIANANVMMIEDANKFGLAQLHQFRGRVGRSDISSYCFLITQSDDPKSLTRLQAMVDHSSGIKLAEIDLELRGPGSLLGLKQSGLPDLKLAKLTDTQAVGQAKIVSDLMFKNGLSANVKKELELIKQTEHLE